MVMTCACMAPPAHDAHHDEPEKPKPKPPTFVDDVPASVQEGLRAAWLGLEAGRPPIGIIADCERVVILMLNELDGNGRFLEPPKPRKRFHLLDPGTWCRPRPPPPIPVVAARIEALIEKRVLLPSVQALVKRSSLDTLKSVNAGAPLGSKAQAEAFLHLALMIAEQGFAHPRWAENLKRPPQWP